MAADGGAISNIQSNALISECTFNDSGYGSGGAIFNGYASADITQSTFIDDYGFGGGAIYNTTFSAPTISNCMFLSDSVSGSDPLSPQPGGGAIENDTDSSAKVI